MRRAALHFLALAVASVWASSAHAEPVVEELFQTETVFPQEAGAIQFTLLPQLTIGPEANTKSALVVFEYGLTDSLQIEIEWQAFLHVKPSDSDEESTQGIGDLEIGVRHSWMNIGGSGFHAALGADFTIPTGNADKDLGEGQFAVSPIVVVAADIPSLPGAQAVANFGTDVGEGSFAFDEAEWFMNAAFFVPVNRLILTTEFNLSKDESFFTPGVLFHPREGLEFGVGVPLGLTKDSDDYRIALMLTWEFGGDD